MFIGGRAKEGWHLLVKGLPPEHQRHVTATAAADMRQIAAFEALQHPAQVVKTEAPNRAGDC